MIPALLFIRKIYNEYESWKFFSALILNDDIFPLFNYDMESMDRMSLTFDQILEIQNKKLFDRFKSIGLDNRIYLLRWFLSIFSEAFSFRQWKRIMDYLVFGGKHKFFRIALVVLDLMKGALKGAELGDAIQALKVRHPVKKTDEDSLVAVLFGFEGNLIGK
jgi:hypothetical protein